MRIVISGVDGSTPVVLEGIEAVILAAADGADDGAVPCIAYGEAGRIAALAAVVLTSIQNKLGAKAFERVIEAARRSTARVEDVSDAIRTPVTAKGLTKNGEAQTDAR